MIITPLGHTEFLVDIADSAGDNVRILVDTWLSDYTIGDLMERSTKIKLDPEKMKSIDAIYISHAHTDHLDAYTLVEIFGNAPLLRGDPAKREGGLVSGDSQKPPLNPPLTGGSITPLLILPVTLRFLAPLFALYLPTAQIHWLTPSESLSLKGIEITGYMFSQTDITNEDAVMMLSIASDTELLFAEIDTVPDEYDADIATELFRIFDKKEYETRCYLASRNELEGQLRMYDYIGNRQKAFRSEYIAGRKEEIRASYEKYEYEEYSDIDNIMTLPGFVRGYIGQGLQYPRSLSVSLAELSIFPLDEIASMESDIARGFGYEFAQKALIPGRQYKIENGTIEPGRKECQIGEIQKTESKNKNQGNTPSSRQSLSFGGFGSSESVPTDDEGSLSKNETRIYAQGPLIPREYNTDELKESIEKIRNILNNKFLPYWSASPVASLRSALIANRDGAYRICFKTLPLIGGVGGGTPPSLPFSGEEGEVIIFEYSFASSEFTQVSYAPDMRIDEDYWLSDILDYLDGRQELYSNFWHQLDPNRIYRLWTCLGADYMNNDLVIAKYRFHFERAKRGETANGWVEGIVGKI